MPAIFTKLDKIKPAYDVVYKATAIVCKVLLAADILVVSYQVAGRYIPFIPDPSWTEQVVLTLMSYMAVLSAALAIRRGAHIRMTAFDNYLPKKLLKVLDILADIAVLVLAVIMIAQGWQYAIQIGSKGNYESMPWLSRFWMYFPVALAGVAMLVFELEAIYNHIKSFYVPEDNKDEKAKDTEEKKEGGK
ncbi:MAG: TRAP transporter small permease [Lachnospiraceae bacterium]|nr:TRAP transporter small permease [Lachnospiraceae bacterium]